jgi:TatD DNase family protein
MLDAHCHIDLYPRPADVADRAAAAGVFTVVVTNLPSAYDRSRPHVAARPRLRLALGLHPLLAAEHSVERDLFRARAATTSFIGEVGLDFSQDGRATAELQVKSFQFVLETIAAVPKFLSIHSRRAEARVLEMLTAAKRSPAVFHWYSGPLGVLRQAVASGHYFSVNPSMLSSPNGQKIIAAIPRDRILTETDGPFVNVAGQPAEPPDVRLVEEGVARQWGVSDTAVRQAVAENFRRLVMPLGKHLGSF